MKKSSSIQRIYRVRKSYIWPAAVTIIVFLATANLISSRKRALFKQWYPHQRLDHHHIESHGLAYRRSDWIRDGIPEYCKMLLKNPKPFDRKCQRDRYSLECKSNGSDTMMFSQFLQDYYLYIKHFRHLKRPGIYVDIATNDPITISNSYFFDRCLQWRGICVEGNDLYHEGIFRERSCELVPTCVSSRDGEVVQFNLMGGLGGIMDATYKNEERREKVKHIVKNKKLRCTTMKSVCNSYGISKIDYLSLDVEGHELSVLQGFGLENVTVAVMTIEASKENRKEIEDYLTTFGYKRHTVDLEFLLGQRWKNVGTLHGDLVYYHPRETFGVPS